MMMFIFGVVTMAAIFFAATTFWLLRHGKKPPDGRRSKKQDMERQLSNLLRYNGTSKGQEEKHDGADD